jgi:hypothetical protein
MKTLLSFSILAVCCAALLITSCKQEAGVSPSSDSAFKKNLEHFASKLTGEDLDAFTAKAAGLESREDFVDHVSTVSARTPVSYIAHLCGETITHTHLYTTSIGNYALGDYYSFSGNAGDPVSIYVARVCEGDMDPIAEVWFGTISDSDEIWSLEIISGSDDAIYGPCGGCFADPYMAFNLPYTGTYTLVVWDFFSCGSPHVYEVITTGVGCDLITIDGCDTGVANTTFDDGSTMEELILACAVGARNHGAFVSCAAQLTGSWVSAGLITEVQKDAIMDCAGSANLP